WGPRSGLRAARQSAEMGQRLIEEQREHLLGRLGHKLRSSVLALQESARQAAFGRPEMLEGLFEQAQEVGRRAAGLEVAAVEPKPLPVPELGEPLVRLIVDTQLDGWLDVSRPDGADIYLPAYRAR